MKEPCGYREQEAEASHALRPWGTRTRFRTSVTNILGSGRRKGYTEMYRGVATEVTLLKKLRVELYLNDAEVDKAMNAIIQGGRTGKKGDGVLYVVDVYQGIRIPTGGIF